jgi:hypothetical protein
LGLGSRFYCTYARSVVPMSEIDAGEVRGADEYGVERAYLNERMSEIEKGMGKVAARGESPDTIGQDLDSLDRARELVSELEKQVLVRPLDEAIDARLDWLERVETRHEETSGEPLPAMTAIPLDRAILQDLAEGWESHQT